MFVERGHQVVLGRYHRDRVQRSLGIVARRLQSHAVERSINNRTEHLHYYREHAIPHEARKATVCEFALRLRNNHEVGFYRFVTSVDTLLHSSHECPKTLRLLEDPSYNTDWRPTQYEFRVGVKDLQKGVGPQGGDCAPERATCRRGRPRSCGWRCLGPTVSHH